MADQRKSKGVRLREREIEREEAKERARQSLEAARHLLDAGQMPQAMTLANIGMGYALLAQV